MRDAYYNLVTARAQAHFAEENLGEVQTVNRLTHLQIEAGASPRVDTVRSGIDLANAKQAEIQARIAENSALASLNVLLGRSPNALITTADDFSTLSPETALASYTPSYPPSSARADGTKPAALFTSVAPGPGGIIPSLDELTRTALHQRPLALAAKAQLKAAEYAEKQARASRLPDVSVDYERSTLQSVQTVVVTGRLPILDFGGISQNIKAAEESRKQAEAQLRSADQQILQQVAQAYNDYVQAQQLVASYGSGILAPSSDLLAMAQLGYKQGATGILPVLDAESTLRTARTGYVGSLQALAKAVDEIRAATASMPDLTALQRSTTPSASGSSALTPLSMHR